MQDFNENYEMVAATNDALILGSAAFLSSRVVMGLVNDTIGTSPEKDGDVLSTTLIEELTLAELQRRIITFGAKK